MKKNIFFLVLFDKQWRCECEQIGQDLTLNRVAQVAQTFRLDLIGYNLKTLDQNPLSTKSVLGIQYHYEAIE